MPKRHSRSGRQHGTWAAASPDLSIIRRGFADHLHALGYAKLTTAWYQRRLIWAAARLAGRGQRLTGLRLDDVAGLLKRCHGFHSRKMLRAAIHCWLRFRGLEVSQRPTAPAKWQRWIDRYERFLIEDCGFAANTCIYRRRYARCFLSNQFPSGEVRWTEVRAVDIWRFSERFCRRVRPSSANVMLCSLRSFLRFVHLQGACKVQLAQAVPHVANYGRRRSTEVLSEEQRHRFLAAFSRSDPRGQRDYTIALCLLDLGLRAQEVVQLRLSDVSWDPPSLIVPATKTDRPRHLPLPAHVAVAIRRYVQRARPTAKACDHLFLRHRSFAGLPFSLSGLRQAMRHAFRRAGMPAAWTGTHRLRHSFAARLHARGADLKQIADLLGHQHLDTSNRYVHVGPQSLRPLAQPWPG